MQHRTHGPDAGSACHCSPAPWPCVPRPWALRPTPPRLKDRHAVEGCISLQKKEYTRGGEGGALWEGEAGGAAEDGRKRRREAARRLVQQRLSVHHKAAPDVVRHALEARRQLLQLHLQQQALAGMGTMYCVQMGCSIFQGLMPARCRSGGCKCRPGRGECRSPPQAPGPCLAPVER